MGKTVKARRGTTLLLCLFVMGIASVLVLGLLDTATVQLTTARHTADYERALYLAGAGVHHMLAELEADPSWTEEILPTEFPAGSGNTYAASVVSGPGGTAIVTGRGISGTITRTLQVTIEMGE